MKTNRDKVERKNVVPWPGENASKQSMGRRHDYPTENSDCWRFTARKIGFSPEEVEELERLYNRPLTDGASTEEKVTKPGDILPLRNEVTS